MDVDQNIEVFIMSRENFARYVCSENVPFDRSS